MARQDTDWQALARLVGGARWAEDTALATVAGRRAHEDAIEAQIAEWTRQHEADAIEALLQGIGVPAHVVMGTGEIIADRHNAACGQIIRLPHPLMGETVFDAARYGLSETPARYGRTAPTFGRDTAHILGDILGYDAGWIAALDAQGALR